MAKSLTQKYNSKKEKTLKLRNCGFKLTIEEYKNLYARATVCDYTGMPFGSGKKALSIERIDDNLPYQADNCCMVTMEANEIKERMRKGAEFNPAEAIIASFIKNTLTTKTREQLVDKYQTSKETIMVSIDVPLELGTKGLSKDVALARAYVQFAESEKDCLVSFAKYKSLRMRKTCCWTKMAFVSKSAHVKRTFTKINLDLPYSDDNIVVVCKILAQLRDQGFTATQLNQIVGAM